MKIIHILIEQDEINDINPFIASCNVTEDFSPSRFNSLEILISNTKDSEKTKLFNLTEDVRFFQVDTNDDTEFNKRDKNITTVAQDYSVLPSLVDLEALKQEIDKDKIKCYWLAVEFEEVVEPKVAAKIKSKSKVTLQVGPTLAEKKAKALEADAMDKAKKIYDKKLVIETKDYRDQIKQLKSDAKKYLDQIKKLELDVTKVQKTSTDLLVQLKNKDAEIVKVNKTKDAEIVKVNKTKNNEIKALTAKLNSVKIYKYTQAQYNKALSDIARYKRNYENSVKQCSAKDSAYNALSARCIKAENAMNRSLHWSQQGHNLWTGLMTHQTVSFGDKKCIITADRALSRLASGPNAIYFIYNQQRVI